MADENPRRFEAPEIAAAFFLWQRELHPFTCGGGGGPCSGVEMELLAANPHIMLLGCPKCERQQILYQGRKLFEIVMEYAARHDPLNCLTCRFVAQSKIGSAPSAGLRKEGGE